MLADRLSKAWDARRGSIAIDAVMRFSDQGLVLGAGTVLAPSAGSERDIPIDPREPRLQALLAAAHLRRPADGALSHLRRAAECWREGEDALTALHLVLSRLDRLQQPDADAHRLFLADGLLRAGIDADAIMAAIESSAEPEPLQKYNADQPRVPAGNGRESGQWTADGGGSATETAPSAQGEVSPGAVTPVADHKANSDAGRRAMIDCIRHVVEDSLGAHANDNWREHWLFECQMAKKNYDMAEFAVETIPKVSGGIVGFPDGGTIIMRKGKDDIYIPAAARRIPPLKRSL